MRISELAKQSRNFFNFRKALIVKGLRGWRLIPLFFCARSCRYLRQVNPKFLQGFIDSTLGILRALQSRFP
jgi:hypothetical protein